MFGLRLVAEFLIVGLLRVSVPAPIPPATQLRPPAPELSMMQLRTLPGLRPRAWTAPPILVEQHALDVDERVRLDERVGKWLLGWVIPGFDGHAAVTVGNNIAHDNSGVRLVGFKVLF